MVYMRSLPVILLLTVSALGCEGRQVGSTNKAAVDGGPLAPRYEAGGYWNTDSVNHKTNDQGPPGPTSGGQCLIAIRVDICCAQPLAALAQHVSQDPCLVPFPPQGFPAGCKKKPDCSTVKCKKSRCPSRLVKAVPGGGCVFVSECATSAECGVATDVRQCCGCPEGYPRSMMSKDPCLVPYGDGPKAGPPCPNPNLCGQACQACFGPSEYPLPSCKKSPEDAKLLTCQIQKISP